MDQKMTLVSLMSLMSLTLCHAYNRTYFYGCDTDLSKTFPYCDFSLSYESRAAFIVANLTLAEKIATIGPGASQKYQQQKALINLCIPPYSCRSVAW